MATQPINTTLTHEIASKAAHKKHALDSDVDCEGLQTQIAMKPVVEKWLAEQVVPAWEALKNGNSQRVSSDQLRARLRAEHEEMNKEK